MLLDIKIPFYAYDDKTLTLDDDKEIADFLNICKKSIKHCKKYIPECYDALAEQSILQALRTHPWNVNINKNNIKGISAACFITI